MRLLAAALVTIAPVAVGLAPERASTQLIRPMVLARATASPDAEFIGVTSIRELADGRVLVTDGRDQRLYVLDLAAGRAGRATDVGRRGKGPGEFSRLGFLHAIGGDSSLVSDMSNRRWMLLDGARIVDHVPPDHPAVRATRSLVHGADAFGHTLFVVTRPTRAGVTEYTKADSTVLVLVSRATGRFDTVTRLRDTPRKVEAEMNANGDLTRVQTIPVAGSTRGESAVLCPDGWIAVLRVDPWRVDWRRPDGQWVRGTPLAVAPDRVDARERRAIEARRRANREQLRKSGIPAPPETAIPTTLPVISSHVQTCTGEGRMLLRRLPTEAHPRPRYLVVNRRGTIDGELTLGPRESVIGFGARSIYLIVKDDDDIQRLRRHPWP